MTLEEAVHGDIPTKSERLGSLVYDEESMSLTIRERTRANRWNSTNLRKSGDLQNR